MTSTADPVLRQGVTGAAVADVRARLAALPGHLSGAAGGGATETDGTETDGTETGGTETGAAETGGTETRAAETGAPATRAAYAIGGAHRGPDADGTFEGTFDADLEQGVRAFQQGQGLIVDGAVGPETFAALDGARWTLGDRILRHDPGHLMHGEDVFALQKLVTELGFAVGRVDGRFGGATEASVRRFQAAYGLRDDGTVGPETLRSFTNLRRSVSGGSAAVLRETELVRRSGHSLSGRIVALDPGHGLDAPGAVVGDLHEADLTLDLARRIEGRLTAIGASVVFTRSAHSTPSDEDRAEVANRSRADVLLSIHCDSNQQQEASGAATFFFGRERGVSWSGVGERLADLIQREMVKRTGLADCRSHPRSWALLRRTQMPAVWIEAGYLSHPDDASRLAEPAFRDTLAEAVVVALQRTYLGEEDTNATGMLQVGDLRAALARIRADA